MVAPPPGFGWVRPQHALPVGRSPLLPRSRLPHTISTIVSGYPAPVLRPGTSFEQTAIAEASLSAVTKNRQVESATTMATTRAAVSPTAATTRQQGLLSFINVPDIPCPEGQRRDPAGNCRDEW
ncbi:uncharacterized protein LOC126237493 [Schistocerca nitens]|uniref:uncharacterized protein LOC126237493 n=1 Tax=Schistocerca nitens TaxID=7011 RepID=UPI0021185A73|nr:uncharacterized protein LOC126237493 [Schistocerca nitens]